MAETENTSRPNFFAVQERSMAMNQMLVQELGKARQRGEYSSVYRTTY